jgi:O-antigen/teichoic acid export membrane protein
LGIIKKQSSIGAVLIYLGIFIGYFNIAFLQPKFLLREEIGLIAILIAWSEIFGTIFSLGWPNVLVRLFPKIVAENKKSNLIIFTIIIIIIGSILATLAIVLFSNVLFIESNRGSQIDQYYILLIPLIIFNISFRLGDTFLRMEFKSLFGIITKELFQRILISFGILLIGFKVIHYQQFVWTYTFAMCFSGVLTLIYLISKINFNSLIKTNFSFVRKHKSEIINIAFYGILGSAGAIVASMIDRVMLSNMIGDKYTGIYYTLFYYGVFVSIPARPLKRISTAVLAESWKKNDIQNIKNIYSKSVLNLSIIGLYLFLGIWLNNSSIIEIVGKEYEEGVLIILFIGVGSLFDMITGLNTEIIATSKFYKYNSYFIGGLALLVILTNWWLIPIYKSVGAAMGTCISIITINTFRLVLINNKIKHIPFDYNLLKTFFIGGLVFFITSFISVIENPFYSILIKGSFITLIFWTLIIVLRVSDDINGFCKKQLQNIKGLYKR